MDLDLATESGDARGVPMRSGSDIQRRAAQRDRKDIHTCDLCEGLGVLLSVSGLVAYG